jgi:hypothetical protein
LDIFLFFLAGALGHCWSGRILDSRDASICYCTEVVAFEYWLATLFVLQHNTRRIILPASTHGWNDHPIYEVAQAAMAVTRLSERPRRSSRNQTQTQIQAQAQTEAGGSGRTLRTRTPRSTNPSDSPETSNSNATGSDHDSRPVRSQDTRQSPTSTWSRPPSRRKRAGTQRQSKGTYKVEGPKRTQKRPNARSAVAAPSVGKRRKLSNDEPVHTSQGKIPNWLDPRIPYDAWASIFFHAGGQGLDTNWIIRAATTCRAFLEPALAAIYFCPQPKTAAKAKRLVALLERPASETIINYRTKVETLFVDISIVPQTILFQMIYPLICLKDLVIFTPLDQPPYRDLDKSLRWSYPAELFRALARDPPDLAMDSGEIPPTFLRTWEWSGRFLGGYVPTVDDIARMHQTPVFSHLTRITFTNFQVPSLYKPQPKRGGEDAAMKLLEEDKSVIESIAKAISQLESLQHLVFESSTVMNHRLLPLLPRTLDHLQLINCWEVRSDDLASFLKTHGSKMRTLTLMHNQSLDLAFLTDLAYSCPQLLELRMNLSYFRHHNFFDDSDPMYDAVLLPEQVPSWPSSIRVIDLEHIRDWSVEAAEMFLQSLIDSAESLPNLRHLAIKTMLNIPWQTRATMRVEWKTKMAKVFLRSYKPPTMLVKAPERPNENSIAPKKARRKRSFTPSRRSGRIAAHEAETSRASKIRPQSRGRSFYKEPDTDEDFGDDDGDNYEGDRKEEAEDDAAAAENMQETQHVDEGTYTPGLPVQGMCKTVSIVFDNQKTREFQYGMEDFLTDDDTESEEEWNSDLDDDDDDVIVF